MMDYRGLNGPEPNVYSEYGTELYVNGEISYYQAIESKNNSADDDDFYILGGTNFPFDKGWSYRIDPPNPNKGEQRHIHVEYPQQGEWSQNEDGTKHKGKSNDGAPPKKVKEKLKEKSGWDWDENIEKNKKKSEENNKKIEQTTVLPLIPPMLKEGAYRAGTVVEARGSIFFIPEFLIEIWKRSMPGYKENILY